MAGLATAALIILTLTFTTGLLPDSWESSLWHQTAPAALEVGEDLPRQPIKTASGRLALDAKGVIAVDIDSGSVLYAKNSDAKRPIASIVKLASALVIVREHKLSETVTVGTLGTYPAGAVTLGLRAGQRFSVDQLLAAALVPSANDAADALAIYDAGSVNAFAAKINDVMKEWGITGVNIVDANGLSSSSQASPAALAKIAELALTNPTISKLVDKPKVTVQDLNGTKYALNSTNELLADKAYDGIKTGFTEAAGESVVALAKVKGHRVITVVLGSPDRFGETRKLVGFIRTNWSWQ